MSSRFTTFEDKEIPNCMPSQSILLLRIKDSYEFFTTPAAMYQHHDADELGISRQSLNNYFSKHGNGQTKFYKNEKCMIVKGPVISRKLIK